MPIQKSWQAVILKSICRKSSSKDLTWKKLKFAKNGSLREIKLKIFHRQSNTISLVLSIKLEGLLTLLSSTPSSLMKNTGPSGLKSPEQRVSSGLPITLNSSSWFIRPAAESSILLKSHGMLRCLRTNGSLTRRNWRNSKHLSKNIGKSLLVTRETRSCLSVKT